MNHEIPRDDFESDNASPEPGDPLPSLADAEPIIDRVREIQAEGVPRERFGFSPRFGHITRRLRSYRRAEGGRTELNEQASAFEIGRLAASDSVDGPRAT